MAGHTNPSRPLTDPLPALGVAAPLVDDVTRLNSSLVERVFHVRNEEDIQKVVRMARERGVKVSCRGTQHTMGAHTIAAGGYVIDCKNLRKLSYDPESGICTTGPGNTWADLIKMLNDYGCSPRTMQSYSTFSVGGSMSVAAHGITTDVPVSESVQWCKLVDAEGNLRHVQQGDELMRYVCGGYGLFGIVYEIGMTVADNAHLTMDMMQTDLYRFPQLFDAVLSDPDVHIKLSRLDVTDLDNITVFVFRRAGIAGVRTVSALPAKPREMSTKQRLMYKWLAPSMQRVRGLIESALGSAMDWSDANERNLLMYESAQPLAELYSPILDIDDTFVLQEYFVPKSSLVNWVDAARPIYARALASDRLTLLNTTIRMVEQDTWSALPYSPHAEGAAAFVLYYRIERTSEADTELAGLHHDLTEITIALGGRFFLPYRHHYTQEQLLAAYPEFPEWVAAKMRVDPACVFWNEWFEHYGLPLCQHAPPVHSASDGRTHALEEEETAAGESKSAFALQFVSERRSQSMQALLQQPQQWRAFREEFLVNIFNLTDDVDLAAKITQAVMRARIEGLDDHTAYVTLQGLLKGRGALGLMADAGKAWRGVKQMHAQRRELLRQAQHILGKLGRLGSLDGLVCVGDPGKLVLELQSVCGVRGSVYVVNDQDPDAQPAIATNLTRRSISAVGRFLPFSYSKPFIPVAVPDASVDLVTMNQGLHHLPQTELMPFLASVVRVLRPGGLLIVREHNATKDLIAMCDAAHWVFNAVSGVSAAAERTEVRAFRSVLEWREVLEGAGLRDSLLYEVEDGDPTQDEMMCFYKPPFWPISAAASHLPHADKPARKALVREESGASVGGKTGTAQQVGKEHGLPRKVQEFLDSIPVSAMDGAKALFEAAEEGLPVAHAMIRERLRLVGPAQRIMVERLVDAVFPMLQDITAKVLALLRKAHVKQGNNMTDLPLDEIFLGLEMLANRPLDQVDPDSTEYTAVVAAEYIWSYLTAEPEEAHKQVKQKDAQPDVAKPLPVKGASLRTSLAQGKGTITERAVDVLIGRLIAARPDLAEQGVVERAGLSRHVTKMTGESRATLVTTLVGFLDAQGLAQLETAVVKVEHGVAQMGAAEHVRRFPAHVRVLMQSAGVPLFSSDSNPWLDVACAVLGCPAVQFTGSGKRMARWAGLQAVIDVWETAQQHRRLHSPAAPSAAELLQQDLSVVGQNVAAGETRREAMDDMMTLEMLAARMSAPSTSSALEVVVDVQSHRDSKIENVASVAHACVRARLRDRPEKGPVVLAHCTALANMILLAGEEGEHSGPRQLRLSVDNVLQLLERLGIEYEVKQEAHTKKRGYRFGDITKGLIKKIDRAIGSTMDAVQGPAKAYDKDTLELVVAWRAWDVETSKSDLAAGVSELLLQNKLVSAARLDAEEYTWYKLSEWMQVEMLAIFAGSLDTVPWYRFPYVSTLKTYFEVLIEEARIVYEKLGPQKAFASMAFITDLVPGIIMCLGFGQLALLGAPLRAYDSANWLAYDESTLTEELVVLVGGDRSGESARAMSADAIDWLALDPRIRKAVPVSKSLAVLTVPTFKPLTEILDKLSDRHNGFLPLMLVTISNHTEVQVRVALSTEGLDETSTLGALHEIDTQEGSALKFQYSFPSDTQTRYASVEVQVPHLLEFFRYCKRSDRLRLMQVYDFYDGIPAD